MMKIFMECLIVVAVVVWLAVPKVQTVKAQEPIDSTKIILQQMMSVISKIESNQNAKAKRFEKHIYEKTKGTEYRRKLLATSWGKYQILGMNYKACGYKDVVEFKRAMASDSLQDIIFTRFTRSQGLDTLFSQGKYHLFAKRYNGKGYKRNRYAEKILTLMEDEG